MSRAVLALTLFVAGCTCQGDKQAAEASSEPAGTSNTPRVAFSAQPWLRGGRLGQTSAAPSGSETPPAAFPNPDRERATEAGYGLHDSASKGCGDQKCIGGNCGRLCTQWMDETIKSFSSPSLKNDTYFNCFGACLAGRRDR